jgi:hypothetical protein
MESMYHLKKMRINIRVGSSLGTVEAAARGELHLQVLEVLDPNFDPHFRILHPPITYMNVLEFSKSVHK